MKAMIWYSKNGRYEMNFEDLEKKVADPRVRIMLICNPHNPVGRVWTKEELIKLQKSVRKTIQILVGE